MSWVPTQGKGKGSENGKGKVWEERRKGVERFGSGMERGGEGGEGRALSEQERSGRTERRRGVRSGSKNTFRRI